MCLALRASGLLLRYATLQNLIPSLPWIAPPCPPPWRNPRKGRDQILPSGNLANRGRSDAAAADPDSDVVIVAGYLTDGPAIKISDKLRIGDVIRLVDGQQVNLTIIEQGSDSIGKNTSFDFILKSRVVLHRDTGSVEPGSRQNFGSVSGSENQILGIFHTKDTFCL